MLKLIFLDIDGVLNGSSTKERIERYVGVDSNKLSLLKQILDATNAKIVLVSTWKEYWYKEPQRKKKQDFLANYLDKRMSEFNLKISDKTDNYYMVNRGEGIKEYIANLKHLGIEVSNYIIIDDEIFDYLSTKMTKKLVRTSFKNGLQEKHVKKAIAMLS